jgi:hypothetical protein
MRKTNPRCSVVLGQKRPQAREVPGARGRLEGMQGKVRRYGKTEQALISPCFLLATLIWHGELATGVSGEVVSISNVIQRYDVPNVLMDAHDGSTTQLNHGGLYYWYEMEYGNRIERRERLFHGAASGS